jgi:hypothetical protein
MKIPLSSLWKHQFFWLWWNSCSWLHRLVDVSNTHKRRECRERSHSWHWRLTGIWVSLESLSAVLPLRCSQPTQWKTSQLCTLTEHHAMKVFRGSGGIAPLILDLGSRWRWRVSFTPRPLYPQGKSPWYPLDRRLGGPQNRSGSGGEEKNSQPLPGLEPSISHPVAQRYTRLKK